MAVIEPPILMVPVLPDVALDMTGRHTVVWLRGEHDLSNVAAVATVLDQAIAITDTNVIVDLSDVQFLSVATARAIARAYDALRSLARALALRDPSSCAQRVLQIYGHAGLAAQANAAGTASDSAARARQ